MTKSMARGQRLESVDYWRGVCLVIITIHHLPLTFSGSFTLGSIGFTDSVAAFFFLSGYVSRLAFDSAQTRYGWKGMIDRAVRRAGVLMLAHLLMVAAAALAIHLYYRLWPGEVMLPFDEQNAIAVAESPWSELWHALTFSQRTWLCHVLPLYIIFVLGAPLLVLLSRFNVWLLWVVSGALWISVRLSITLSLGVDLMPDRFWLNPYAWQFVFVSGFVMSELIASKKISMTIRPFFLVIGGWLVVVIAAVRLNLFSGAYLFDPIWNTKTLCDFSYVFHFALLALVVSGFFSEERTKHLPGGRVLKGLGRHSLAFWVTSALWVYAMFFLVRALPWPAKIKDVVVLTATLLLMIGVTRHWERGEARKKLARATVAPFEETRSAGG